MQKVSLDKGLYARVQEAVAKVGYSSVEEFVAQAVEAELKRLRLEEAEQQVADQLRGLGYLE